MFGVKSKKTDINKAIRSRAKRRNGNVSSFAKSSSVVRKKTTILNKNVNLASSKTSAANKAVEQVTIPSAVSTVKRNTVSYDNNLSAATDDDIKTKSAIIKKSKIKGIQNRKRKVITKIVRKKDKLRKRKHLIIVTLLLSFSGLVSSFLFGVYDRGQIDVQKIVADYNNRLLAENSKDFVINVQNNPKKPDGGLIGLSPDKEKSESISSSSVDTNGDIFDNSADSDISTNNNGSTTDITSTDSVSTEKNKSNTSVTDENTSSAKASSSIIVGDIASQRDNVVTE